MARTLQDLKDSIENLIQLQGKNAPVAAFIFTSEDVVEYDENGEPFHFTEEQTNQVLNSLSDKDWIYDKIFSAIEDEITLLKQ
jgi:hypothetical protein